MIAMLLSLVLALTVVSFPLTSSADTIEVTHVSLGTHISYDDYGTVQATATKEVRIYVCKANI